MRASPNIDLLTKYSSWVNPVHMLSCIGLEGPCNLLFVNILLVLHAMLGLQQHSQSHDFSGCICSYYCDTYTDQHTAVITDLAKPLLCWVVQP